ncbi:hypothetical protein NKG94_36385 [Micromonospora sp. M12]
MLSAAKSYSERLFRYQRIDRLDRIAADQALCAPAEREEVEYEQKALDLLYEKSGGYPTSSRRTARPPGITRRARRSPPPTCGSPHRRRKPSWPSGSSDPASNGPLPPNASTCGRWP